MGEMSGRGPGLEADGESSAGVLSCPTGGADEFSAAYAAPPVTVTGGRAEAPSMAAMVMPRNNVRLARMGLFFCLNGLDNLLRHGLDQVAQGFQHQVVGSAARGQTGA